MSDATPVPPDTKDWTWVLERQCPECGFTAADLPGEQVGATLRETLPRWRAVLRRVDVRERPAPGVWSLLEYACHVRDVFDVFEGRVRLMLAEDSPTFANWDQDTTAAESRYAEQDPRVVADELDAAGARAAAAFDAVGDGWDRPGLRSNGSVFTVTTLGQYFVHDVVHHLHDVAG